MFQHMGFQECMENTITGHNQGNLPPLKDISFDKRMKIFISVFVPAFKNERHVFKRFKESYFLFNYASN